MGKTLIHIKYLILKHYIGKEGTKVNYIPVVITVVYKHISYNIFAYGDIYKIWVMGNYYWIIKIFTSIYMLPIVSNNSMRLRCKIMVLINFTFST